MDTTITTNLVPTKDRGGPIARDLVSSQHSGQQRSKTETKNSQTVSILSNRGVRLKLIIRQHSGQQRSKTETKNSQTVSILSNRGVRLKLIIRQHSGQQRSKTKTNNALAF